jgi:hypothetical protein
MIDLSKALKKGRKVTIKYGEHPVQWYDIYHIRGIVDGDRVVTRSWNPGKKRWDYKVVDMHWFVMTDKDPDITVKVGNPTKAQQKKALREYVEAGIRREFSGKTMTKAKLKKIQKRTVELVSLAREEGFWLLPEMPDPVISLHPEQDGQAVEGSVEMKFDIDPERLAASERKWARRTGATGPSVSVDEPKRFIKIYGHRIPFDESTTVEQIAEAACKHIPGCTATIENGNTVIRIPNTTDKAADGTE